MLKTLLQRTRIFLAATSNLLPSLPKQSSILSQSLEASVPIQSSESSNIASPFSLFKDHFDKKLSALKSDIQDELCSNTDSVTKKLKEESRITFRFEGNKKQFQFNSDLAAKVKSASVALGKRKLDLVKLTWKPILTSRSETNVSD